MMVWVWLGIFVLCLVGEAVSLSMTSIWFAAGALVALVLSLFEAVPAWVQIVAFVVVSLLLFFLLRKWCMTKFSKSKQSTNADRFVGQYVRMLSEADFDNLGTAELDGVVWNVKSKNGDVLAKDEIVEIVGLEGNKYIAKKKEDK